MKNRLVSAKILQSFISRLFIAAGVNRSYARTVAESLVMTSLRGVDSHGIRLAVHYLREVLAGRINIRPGLKFRQTGPSTGVLDADHTFGAVAGMAAMGKAIGFCQKMVWVPSRSKIPRILARRPISPWSRLIKEWLPLPLPIRSPGGAIGGESPVLGTIPFALPAHGRGNPFCLDMATAGISWNKMVMMQKATSVFRLR